MENEQSKNAPLKSGIKMKSENATANGPDLLNFMEDIVGMVMKPPKQSTNPFCNHLEIRQTMTVESWMSVIEMEKEKAFEAGRDYERINGDWITGAAAMAYLECSSTTLHNLRDNGLIDFGGKKKDTRYFRPSLLHYKSKGQQGRRIGDEPGKIW